MERTSTRTSYWCPVTRSSSRSLVWFLAGVLVLAISDPASSRQRFRATPSIRVTELFTSNVFYSEEDEEVDYVTRVAPQVELRYDSDRDTAKLRAGVISSSYLRHSGLNGVTYSAKGSLDHKLSPRLSLGLDGAYRFYPNLDAVTQDDQLIQSARPDLEAWNLGGGLSLQQSARSNFGLNFAYSGRRYHSAASDPEATERDYESISSSFLHRSLLSARDRVDLTLGAYQTRYSNVGAGTQEDRFGTILADWFRSWDSRWSSSLSGGLRLLHSDPENVAAETTLGFIGGASLHRKSQKTSMVATISRTTRPGSGVGASLDVTSVGGSLRFDLTERVGLHLDGRWQLYKSAANGAILVSQGVPSCGPGETQVGSSCFRDSENQVDSELTSLQARLDWRLRKHWVTFLSYDFRHQTSSGDIEVSEYQVHLVLLGVRYALPVDLF